MNLTDLRKGQIARVCAIRGTPHLRRRLMELGLIRGAQIKVVRYAPLKDPIQISVKGSSLALRCDEGQFIDVQILESHEA